MEASGSLLLHKSGYCRSHQSSFILHFSKNSFAYPFLLLLPCARERETTKLTLWGWLAGAETQWKKKSQSSHHPSKLVGAAGSFWPSSKSHPKLVWALRNIHHVLLLLNCEVWVSRVSDPAPTKCIIIQDGWMDGWWYGMMVLCLPQTVFIIFLSHS